MKKLVVEMRIAVVEVDRDYVPIKDQKPVGSVTSQNYFWDDVMMKACGVDNDTVIQEIIKTAQDIANSMPKHALDKFVEELSKRG